MTHDRPPRKEAVEIPRRVSVNGYYGQEWQGAVRANKLTHRRQADRSYALLDLTPDCTHIAMRMSDGDIVMLLVVNPTEQDNERRGYRLTSVAMNRGTRPDSPLVSLEVPYTTVADLTITKAEHLQIGGLQSDGTVTELITYDKTRPVRDHDAGRLPEPSITADFMAALGRDI